MDNKDLIWDLDVFQKKQRAQRFVMGFENKLCVFSSSVWQLYTNYNIFFPKEEDRKLVILPNPYAHHDNFYGIKEEAVRPTGMFIIPADPKDEQGRLHMMIPFRSEKARYRKVPMDVGLQLINQKRPKEKPFLPVVMKGDLRELNQNTPCLHLHSLQLAKLPLLSAMEMNSIQSVVLERVSVLANRK